MGTARRKGEKPVPRSPLLWTDPWCRIPQALREGNGWLYCWYSQQCVPIPRLARQSGVPETRLRELELGEAPTLEELAALAGPLRTDVASLRASVELAALLRRG